MATLDLWFTRLEADLRALYRDAGPCHDLGHAIRVARLAAHIAVAEGVPPDLAVAAGLLHDAGHAEAVGLERDDHELRSARLADRLLEPWLGDEARAAVVAAVAGRRFAKMDRPRSALGRVLDDADNLDALGWIGVSRVFLYAGEHGWDEPATASPDRLAAQSLDALSKHWGEKLSRLAERMRTDLGRSLAGPRQERVATFIGQLRGETEGPRAGGAK